jgi:hypothetical protein
VNGYQTAYGGGIDDAFVTELSADGTALVYSTYLGGSGDDRGYGIAVDEDGNAYVTGRTSSTDFPTTPGAFQTTSVGGQHAFVSRIRWDGTALDYSTYYGGSGNDVGTGIALDAFHNAFITGQTTSPDLPLAAPLQGNLAGTANAFVAEFDPIGDALVNATYWGGSASDQANGIAVLPGTDGPATDSVFLTGFTQSRDFPTVNALFNSLPGVINTWVARLQAVFIPVIDVIPNGESAEANQNSEPSIAVSPGNTQNMVLSAFGSFTAPGRNSYFTSPVGGFTLLPQDSWNHFNIHNYGYNDSTVSWSPNGPSYASFMFQTGGVPRWNTNVAASPNPQVNAPANQYQQVAGSPMTSNLWNIDQPHIAVSANLANDQVFVGVNDLNQTTNAFMNGYLGPVPPGTGGNGRSAAVRLSRNAQAGAPAWNTVVVETVNPGAGADGPVYVAVSGNRVYATFMRFNAAVGAAPNSDFRGDLVIVRDDNAGANNFTDLNVNILQNVTFPVFVTRLGANQRLGSNLSVAIDPNNGNNVYVAYTDVNGGGQPQVHVMFSNNAGAAWNNVFNAPANTGLPALAVSNNGTVGLLYTRFNNNNLETHFVRTRNNFAAVNDATLERFPDGNPVPAGNPYIGDYEGLVAVGSWFYGTFSGSNQPLRANFPRGVFYQRNVQVPAGGPTRRWFVLNGNGQLVDLAAPPGNVAVSIDPFYFFTRELP